MQSTAKDRPSPCGGRVQNLEISLFTKKELIGGEDASYTYATLLRRVFAGNMGGFRSFQNVSTRGDPL